MEPRTTQVTRHLKYQFSQAERNDLASELANAYYDRSELESQLASIKADFKGRIGAIETQIEKHTRRIRDGYEMREIECEVQFHRPEDGMKRVVRLDTGEEVAVEYMLPHERQEILPFVEAEQVEEPEQESDEAEEAERTYPQPNEHGVYRKSEALREEINVDKRRYARVFVLQIGQKLIGYHQVPEFIAAVDWQLGEGGHSEPLSRPTTEKYIYGSAAAAFRAALGRLAEGMNSFIAPERPRPDVKAASKIADWAENLAKTKYGPQGAGEHDPETE